MPGEQVLPAGAGAPTAGAGRRTVVLARTSLPPCFSVIAIPASAPDLSAAGRADGSYSVEVSRGSHSAARPASARRAGTTE